MRVLIIGWRAASVEAFLAEGADVFCFAAERHIAKALAVLGASRVASGCDLSNVEALVSAAERREWRLGEFSCVVSSTEYSVVAAAFIAGAFGCRGLSVSTSIRLRDKLVQKRAVASAGVKTARVLAHYESPGEIGEQSVGGDFVLKPVSSSGTVGVHVVRAPQTLDIVSTIAAHGPGGTGAWLIEELVDGDEYQIDGTVHAGKLGPFAISRYFANPVNVREGAPVGAVVLPRSRHMDEYAEVGELLTSALAGMGHHTGVFHLELFASSGGWVFGECAGRISGGDIDEAVRLGAGFSLHVNWARAALGRAALQDEGDASAEAAYWGDVQLTCPDGKIRSLPSECEILDRPGVVSARFRRQVGDHVEGSADTTFQHAAAAIVRGNSFEEVSEAAADLALWFLRESVVEASS